MGDMTDHKKRIAEIRELLRRALAALDGDAVPAKVRGTPTSFGTPVKPPDVPPIWTPWCNPGT